MVIDVDKIQEKEFSLFRKAANKFYKKRQERYFEELEEKIESGLIDVEADNYEETCYDEAESFMSTRPQEVLMFIKAYVDNRSNQILDAVADKKLTRGEGKIQLDVLKHVLEAGEVDSLK